MVQLPVSVACAQVTRERAKVLWRSACLLTAALLVGCAGTGPVSTGPSPVDETSAAYDTALAAMVQRPDDPEVTLAFVARATEAGDLRGAIAALERLVLLRPELANIKLELGILYRQTGQDELAKTYLEQAMADPDIPPDMERRARNELAFVSGPRTTSELTVSGFAGVQYDTNANAASARVRGFNQAEDVFQTGRNRTDEKEGVGLSGRLGLSHRYDLGNQRGDSWDSDLGLYGLRYPRVESATVALLDAETGPTFRLARGGYPLDLHPFVAASTLGVAGVSYRNRVGAGLRAETRLGERLSLQGSISGSLDSYRQTVEKDEDGKNRQGGQNSDADDRDGGRVEADVGLRLSLGPSTELTFSVDGRQVTARRDWQAFHEVGGSIALTQLLPNPLADVGRPASVELSAGLHRSSYDEPDPEVDPDLERRDTLLELGASFSLPVSDTWTTTLNLGWNDNSSRVPNERYDNLSVLIGASFRFGVTPSAIR